MPSRWPLLLIWLMLWLVAPIALVRMLWAIITGNTQRAWTIALSFDNLGNTASNGQLGQSISSRAAHNQDKWWGRVMCRLLDRINPGHCERALNAKNQNLK